MKIVVFGAESTGKTSLTKGLATYYNTVWVPEYARKFLQKKYDDSGEICAYEDLMPIAKGQLKLEKEAEKKTKNNLIFCDTNPLQTYYYGKAYYENFEHRELWELIQKQSYDFYFLTYIDTPWVADDLRDKPNEREKMHQLFKSALTKNNIPFMLLKGSKNERLNKAIQKVDRLLQNSNKRNK